MSTSNGGLFISIEGGEGAGKSTVIAALSDLLSADGREVVLTREPGGTPEGEAMRAVLLDPANHVVPEAELLLMFAARAQLVRLLIRPALDDDPLHATLTELRPTPQLHGLGAGRAAR